MILVWFRRDLRLEDNPAWAAATARAAADGDIVQAVYVLDETLLERAGSHRRNQLLAHLHGLAADLEAAGGTLLVCRGSASSELSAVASKRGATSLWWNNDVTPYATERDNAVVQALAGLEQHRFWGILTRTPGTVLTQKGTLSQVFTPFYKAWQKVDPVDVPLAQACSLGQATGVPLPEPDNDPPQPGGTTAAHQRLTAWLDKVSEYPETRDLPGIEGTSQLSADLRFGVLGPREVLDAIDANTDGGEAFVRQLAWRDWYAHMLLQNPDMVNSAVKAKYDAVPWLDDEPGFQAWAHGQTGYPIVDAGMRQLRETGWMHNRVRMIVASFLVKDLLVDWRRGERLFRHLLVDADVSQNVGNWQWAAGTGCDAAPYFRVFNPVSQSQKFDAQGVYLRRWCPELRDLDNKTIHAPWTAGPLDLAGAGVILGDNYPEPIVDHKMARERALATYKSALDQ